MHMAVYLRRGLVISDVRRDLCIALALPHVCDNPLRRIFSGPLIQLHGLNFIPNWVKAEYWGFQAKRRQ